MPYLRATRVAATIAKVVAGLCALAALYFGHALLVALFVFIIIAGEMEYRAVQRREVEDAHWRAVLSRVYLQGVPPPPTEEPPVLTR
jgi:hypothetical protein